MQYDINVLFQNPSGLIFLVLAVMGSFLIISCTKNLQQKYLNKKLLECIISKDEMLAEFKKIRHEYNNMLQTVTCLIEEDDLDGLKEYNKQLLQKTCLLNKNNLTQLIKVKDRSILRILYKLYINAKETGITLNLTIYNDIADMDTYKTKDYTSLEHYLNHAYSEAVKQVTEIDLGISANDRGLRFNFKSHSCIKTERITLKPTKSKKNAKRGNGIFCNTFIQDAYLIQEIIVLFSR